MRLKQLDLERPASLIAFADANDWWMSPDAWNAWESRAKHDVNHNHGNALIAYRNGGKAAAITFAGNAVLLDRVELNPETPSGAWRWYFNGRRWD